MSLGHGSSIVRNGLVLYLDAANRKSYPGSGTTWSDISNNGNNGTLVNGVAYSSNNNGTFNFDKTNDYVSCGNILNNVTYTKIAWFRPETASANIISGGTESQHAFWMQNTSNTLYAGHNGNWSTVSYSPGNMLNTWWFGAVTFNTTTGWILYLNGSQVASNSNTTTFTGNGKIRIGAYEDVSNLFDGDISNVQIYNRVLTGNEIRKNFEAHRGRYSI